MKVYLLDTNIISEPTKKLPSQKVLEKIADNIDYSCISAITWAEMLTGVKTLTGGKRKTGLLDYCIEYVQKQYEILPFDAGAASIYSDLFEKLKVAGTPVQKFDLLIASIAISNNLILVSRNINDFKYISEQSTLMLENWFE